LPKDNNYKKEKRKTLWLEQDDYDEEWQEDLKKSTAFEGAGMVRVNRTDHICAGGWS